MTLCQGMTLVMPQVPQNKYGFTGRGKNRHHCHPEPPSGVRDLHLHWYLNWYRRLHWNFPSLPSEISNLKFEISDAFAFVSGFACCSTFSATSLAAEDLFLELPHALRRTNYE
jgi:hypothetical protein